MSLRTLWYYLTSYSNALTALASLVGAVLTFLAVVVATVYARLTWRLAQTAKLQAESSAQQARAAAEQARIARQVFEASHRPYLEAGVKSVSFFVSPEFFRIGVAVKNHGPMPATLLGWRALIRRARQVVAETHLLPPEIGRCLFQGQGATLDFARGGGLGVIIEPAGPTELEVTVEYRGTHETHYATRIVATKESGRAWEYTAEEVG